MSLCRQHKRWVVLHATSPLKSTSRIKLTDGQHTKTHSCHGLEISVKSKERENAENDPTFRQPLKRAVLANALPVPKSCL